MSKGRVFVLTYGCQMNERDSEALRTSLEAQGYTLAEDEHSADIVLLNTCSVRELAEVKAIGKAGHLLRRKKRVPNFKVGIIGCMAQNRGAKLLEELPGLDFIAGPQSLSKIPKLLDNLISSPAQNIDGQGPYDFSFYEKLSKKPRVSAFVPIQQGCDMHCSYCIVPQTRGAEQNRAPESILNEIRSLAEQGTREIILLGQIVNKYQHSDLPGSREKTSFVQLIEKISEIDKIKRIRFVSPHPTYFRQDLIDAFVRLPKLCPSLHLPIQSASNKILRAMKRPYTKEKLFGLISQLRERIPSIGLSTDIIVGFPGETEEDFQETYAFFDAVGFEMAYIFKYSPRPVTDALRLQENNIPDEIKEVRNRALLNLLHKHSAQKHEALVGSVQEVLIENYAPKRQGRLMGRTPCYKKVILEAPPSYLGQIIWTKIETASANTLMGTSVI